MWLWHQKQKKKLKKEKERKEKEKKKKKKLEYLAESSLRNFIGCLSSNANNSPPGQKSVIKQMCVGVWGNKEASV